MSETFDDQTRRALTAYRMEQAQETLVDVEYLLAGDRLNAAASRIYYACFYAAEAVLIHRGIKAATHVGVRQMFGLHFTQTGVVENKWGRFLTQVAQMREGADYDFFIRYEKEELIEKCEQAKAFIEILKRLLENEA